MATSRSRSSDGNGNWAAEAGEYCVVLGDQKSLTISARSYELLSQLAERDGVTFSDVLEHYLAKALNSGRGRARGLQVRKAK